MFTWDRYVQQVHAFAEMFKTVVLKLGARIEILEHFVV